MAKDLRSFLAAVNLRMPEELFLVNRQVDPRFELSAILEKLQKEDRFPAVLFRNVKGSPLPVLSNLHASFRRLAFALDTTVDNMVEEFARRLADGKPIKTVTTGPVKEVVWKGNEIDLTKLPVVTHNERDAGPYITCGVTIVKDPDTGALNAGMYRHQFQGKDQIGIMVNPSNHNHYVRERYAQLGRPMEVAIAIGHHPGFTMAAITKLEGIGGELLVAGGLLREPLEVVPAETVDLPVPAHAEIVLEGVVDPDKRVNEGPFGEWPGYYTGGGDWHFVKVTAVTMRHDALYQDLFNAHPEHTMLGALPRMGSLLHRVREAVPSVKMVNLPISGCCRVYAYISMNKTYDGEPKQAAFAAFAVEPNLCQVVVVDDDVDVFNEIDVRWAIATRFDAREDLIVMPNCIGSHLSPAAYDITHQKHGVMQTKLIFDATKPAPPTYFPPRAYVPTEVMNRINLNDYLEPYDTSMRR